MYSVLLISICFGGWAPKIGQPSSGLMFQENWFSLSQKPLINWWSLFRNGCLVWFLSIHFGNVSWCCPCSGLVPADMLMLFHSWSTLLLCRWQVLKIVRILPPGDYYYHCLLWLYWTFLTVWTLSWTKECFPQPLPTQFKKMQWKMFNINKNASVPQMLLSQYFFRNLYYNVKISSLKPYLCMGV